jgi:hypothetical protein
MNSATASGIVPCTYPPIAEEGGLVRVDYGSSSPTNPELFFETRDCLGYRSLTDCEIDIRIRKSFPELCALFFKLPCNFTDAPWPRLLQEDSQDTGETSREDVGGTRALRGHCKFGARAHTVPLQRELARNVDKDIPRQIQKIDSIFDAERLCLDDNCGAITATATSVRNDLSLRIQGPISSSTRGEKVGLTSPRTRI